MHNHIVKGILAPLFVVAISGCSQSQLSEGGRYMQREACSKIVNLDERLQCIEDADWSKQTDSY